jgi:hypothetical protein
MIIPGLQLRMPMEPGVTFGDLRWKGRDAAQQELRPPGAAFCQKVKAIGPAPRPRGFIALGRQQVVPIALVGVRHLAPGIWSFSGS